MRAVVVLLLMMIVCAGVICESAAVAKQQRDVRPAAENLARWIPGFANNKRFIIPSIKHLTSEQKHRRTVSMKTALMDYSR